MPRPRLSPRIPYLRHLSVWLLALLLLMQTSAHGDPREAQRQTYVAAETALRLGNRPLFERLVGTLRDYPLYPYLIYEDLRARLDRLPAREVQRFLTDYSDTPLASRLRKAWLRQLATEQRWKDYLAFLDEPDDTTQECWRRQALLAQGQKKAALQNIDTLWLRGRSQPEACDPLFALWKQQGGFTRDRIWTRFTLAMEAGQAGLGRYLRGLMPAADRPVADLWLAVHEKPSRILDFTRFNTDNPYTTTILLHGLDRWSRRDSVAAARAMDAVQKRFPLPEHDVIRLQRRLAVFIAARGHPDALRRLTALPEAAVDSDVREWRVRVGLQQGDWPLTLKWLDELAPDEQQQDRWRYWRARALEATGRSGQAETLYQSLAMQRSFYGFLSADRIAAPYRLNHAPAPTPDGQWRQLASLPGFQRAHELMRLGRLWQGRVEWLATLATLPEAQLGAAARLARHWGWHDRAIITLARLKHWDDVELRFPLPYRQPVLESARQEALHPAWIYAVMRQESIFQPDARSTAGALGLMQILPSTGRHIARRLDQRLHNKRQLYDADTNIRFGSYYLRTVLDRLQDNTLLATAAYNAGPGRVRSWLPEHTPIEADRWAETIPYSETRNYVQRVLEYATVYAQRLGTQQTRRRWTLSEHMPPIQPARS